MGRLESGAGNSLRRWAMTGLSAAGLLIFVTPAWTLPFVPAGGDVVLEHLPDAKDPIARTLRQQHRALQADPRNLALALDVARQDLGRSRALADPRYLGRAEAALAAWPDGPTTPPEVLLLRAIALQSNHDFDGAIRLLHRVLAAKHNDAQASLVLASIDLVQGRYEQSLVDCGQFAVAVMGLTPDTCTASAMGMSGHAKLALAALTLSLQENVTAPAAIRSWALTDAAEIAARLNDPSAEARFRQALAVDPSDAYLLGAWTDWLLDHGRNNEVADLLSDKVRVDPLLLRLALAEQALGRPEAAGHIADLGNRFEASRLRGETVHRREEARYCLHLLHRPDRALPLAQANWDVQRESADARILMESAMAAHRPEAALPVLQWMRDNRVEDAKLAALRVK